MQIKFSFFSFFLLLTELQAYSDLLIPPTDSSDTNNLTKSQIARRKSRIERQKEALEQKWAAERVPKHVKKTKWQVDKSTGTYRKKIVLDFD